MTRDAASVPAWRRLTLPIAVPFLAIIALLSWGLSSAVGASPDDDFHLASIWCGHGDAAGCSAAVEPDERVVYRDLVIDSVCFAFNADASAACHGADFGANPDDVVSTQRGNFTGLYPPVFYFVMSLFATPDIETSVLVMKLVNSVIFVGMAALLFWLLPRHRRPTLLASLVVSLVPLGLFLIPSTNPSSWAIISAGTLWLALLGTFESVGWRRLALGSVALLATVMGAGARADAAIYAGLAVVLVLFVAYRRTRAYLHTAAFAVALAIIAVLLYLTSHQGDAATSGLDGSSKGSTNPLTLVLANLINIPSLWAGVFGSWNLGWLDTVLPASVWVAALACFVGAVFLGLGVRAPRKGISVVVLVAALIAVPTLLLVQSNSIVGANFQPRYLLPLMVMLAGFVLLTEPGRPIPTTTLQRWVFVVALSLANAVALQVNIRRYVTGADVASVDLDSGTEWWWHIPFSPMTVWVIGSLAFAGTLVALNSRTFWAKRVPAGP